MDRTTFLSNVTIVGGKKNVETDKYTENFLCEEIHNNLFALSFMHPFTDELKIQFERVSVVIISIDIIKDIFNIFICPFFSGNVHKIESKSISTYYQIFIYHL